MEKKISESAHKVNYICSWETGEYPRYRRYSREFETIKEMAKFICKHPERFYTAIYEHESWTEEVENFFGFQGVGNVSCGKVTRDFLRENICWSELVK